MNNKPSINTLSINAGAETPKSGRAFRSGPEFASTYHLFGDVDQQTLQYGRFDQATWQNLERGIATLEGGETIIFPSGMAAASSILTCLLKPGQTVLLPSDGYSAVVHYVQNYLVKFGIHLKTIATRDIDSFDFASIDLALLETPSNPMLDTFDIKLAAAKLHQRGGLLAVDNTTLTFLGQQALSLGADITLSADTKAVNGHSDVLYGHVSTKNTALAGELREWRKYTGNVPGPMETWLVHRSLSTLDVRLQRMCENAQHVAETLAEHPQVISIRYPGLASDPSFEIAKKQQRLFGFIISFELADKAKADKFLEACKLLYIATSFGGVHSMAERRARWGTDDIAEGVIRLSVGCERIEDLLTDLTTALDSL